MLLVKIVGWWRCSACRVVDTGYCNVMAVFLFRNILTMLNSAWLFKLAVTRTSYGRAKCSDSMFMENLQHFLTFSLFYGENVTLTLGQPKGWPMPVTFLYLSLPWVKFFICHFGLDLAIFLYVPYPFLVVLPVFFSVVKTSKALLCVDHQDPNTAAPIHSILFTRPGPRTWFRLTITDTAHTVNAIFNRNLPTNYNKMNDYEY